MKQNPFEPSLPLTKSSEAVAERSPRSARRWAAGTIACIGYLLVGSAILFIFGNAFHWIQSTHPAPVKALMCFVIAAFGAVPAAIGFALQRYSRGVLRRGEPLIDSL
ncbi:MAG: hypothetical protein ACR2NZ_18650 [Rubripirellula sp.]